MNRTSVSDKPSMQTYWNKKVMRQHTAVFYLMLAVMPAALDAGCPDGYLSLSPDDSISYAAQCNSSQIPLGTLPIVCDGINIECSPDLACTAGLTSLNLSNGTSIPLYSSRLTTHTLNVLINNKICYVNLLAGAQTGTINIQSGSTVYHAAGVQRCLTLDASEAPMMTSSSSQSVGWSATINSITLHGISHCGTSTGSVGTTTRAIDVSTTLANNQYCWCRITRPSSSNWTYAYAYTSNTTCDTSCGQKCADLISLNSTFRKALINSMTK